MNFPIKYSEIKDINNSDKNEEEDLDIDASKKESNILDILEDKKSNINLTSQNKEMKSPTEKKKKKSRKEVKKKKKILMILRKMKIQ